MMSPFLEETITYSDPSRAPEVHLRPAKSMERNTNTLSRLKYQKRNKDEHMAVEDGMSQSAQRRNLQSWNKPRRNAFRVSAVYCSFFVFGLNDGAYGALLPSLETYYRLSYTVVSLIFLSPLIGYTIASLLNSTIHINFGLRGVAILATCSHITAYAVISAHPPYPAVVVMYAIAGFGNGLIDGGWNAWIGNLEDANALQGFLSSSYSLGATISPIVATSIAEKQDWGWYTFYWFIVSLAVVALTGLFTGAVNVKYVLTQYGMKRLDVPPCVSSSFPSHFGTRMAPHINTRLETNRAVTTAVPKRRSKTRLPGWARFTSLFTLGHRVSGLMLSQHCPTY
jgi:MFS family permease